ncbi:MAG TPA: DUF3301 domain-containing protein [Gammaproteobacteria bacterium]|nr:DUF3301 domain-containing protein [Gammaproteobacteria bacterium]
MYIDGGTWIALALLALTAVGAWFWNDSLRARERMLETCARICRELRVQFLDESVALTRLSLGRSGHGWPEFTRVYAFEFSGTGQDRWQGRATLAGRRVISVQFDHPEGVTILGGGSAVTPDALRLTRTAPDGDERRLH